ncbi:hypothetical protein PCC7424_1696 [Gloeothece citriformis PCC 7424]|uniref:DUF5132 domain-containing protein n=1 Tax=Gloeothece citriformis (strain PCC 7424) TaxID=65393 RepID=B7KB21_GLOC7|nr:hypothetical protein [Gloeothece citriformis]ACK70131.1 hypothetical protein PCC7424_1696 [Gloeothece citriformis PCC 7424]
MIGKYELGRKITNRVLGIDRCLFPGMTVLLVGTLGTLVLAPILIPAVKKVGHSLAKATVKGGIIAYEGTQELLEEAKAELATTQPKTLS